MKSKKIKKNLGKKQKRKININLAGVKKVSDKGKKKQPKTKSDNVKNPLYGMDFNTALKTLITPKTSKTHRK